MAKEDCISYVARTKGIICQQYIVVIRNPVFHSQIKHVEICHHFTRDLVMQEEKQDKQQAKKTSWSKGMTPLR